MSSETADSQKPNNDLTAAYPSLSQPTGLQINPNVSPIFDVNKVLTAMNTYVALNGIINNMIGIDLVWFRAVPQQRAKDVIFQEFVLSNVSECPLQVKGVVPGGTIPDSKYNYDLMGLEYEVPFEIDMDKRYWENIAGFGTAPQKKDIVYVPISNKLYQVESSYLYRGFMEQETTWKCNLKKYSPEASRRESEALKQTIDQYTVSEQELFGLDISSNIAKLTDDKQFSAFNSTTRDKYKNLDSNLQIINLPLNIFGTLVAESYYDMNTSDTFEAIEYKSGDSLHNKSDRSLMSWIVPRTLDNTTYEVSNIIQSNLLTYPANFKIQLKSINKVFNIGDTFNISRPGALNFYAKVIDNQFGGSGLYYVFIDTDVISYLNNIKSDWFNARNYKMSVKDPINLINGRNAILGTTFSADIYSNQFVKIIYGSQQKVISLDNKLVDNNWYGVVINIGNSWGQYNVSIWQQSNDPNDKLQMVESNTINLVVENIEIDNYYLNKSTAYQTSIRLFTNTMKVEKQEDELLTYFSVNADKALILDNADILFTGPYIAKAR